MDQGHRGGHKLVIDDSAYIVHIEHINKELVWFL